MYVLILMLHMASGAVAITNIEGFRTEIACVKAGDDFIQTTEAASMGAAYTCVRL